MTDGASSKKPSIPDWQISPLDQTSDSSSKTAEDAGGEFSGPDRDALVDQARIFLEDESVRDSPREEKIAFLEKKGLQGDEIQKLLKSASPEPTSSAVKEGSLTTTTTTTVHESSTPSSSSQATPESQTTSRDIPPIITYPEFLLRPAKPAPLITFERLSYSVYTLASISALTYGASRYLIQPMLQSLTCSRHDLARAALDNLERFNARLETTVSHIPNHASNRALSSKTRGEDDGHADGETVDGDSDFDSDSHPPTGLFHRDRATQTSPRLLASPSPSPSSLSRSSSSPSDPKAKENDNDATTTTQSTQLTSLATSLSSLLATETSTRSSALSDAVSDCQSQLRRLQFSVNAYGDYDAAKKEDEADEATRFRQEIRSVKGALLGVRNFPVGRPATSPGVGRGA